MNKFEIDQYVAQNNISKVKSFLKNKGNINQRIRQYAGTTLLYTAVISNTTTEMIQILIDNKADINIGQYCGQTPLHAAITENKFNIVKMLIKNKANILINGKYNSNSIIHSISLKRFDILDYLTRIQLKKTKTLFRDKFQVFDIEQQFSLEEWCLFKKHKNCLSIILNFKNFIKNGKKYNVMVNTLKSFLNFNLIHIIQHYIIGKIE